MKKLILALLGGLLLLAGCNKREPVLYAGLESGRLDAGVFTTDNGVRMTIAGNEGNFDVRTSRRVLLSYRTHPLTGDAVEIDVQGLWDAEIIGPDPAEALPDQPGGSPLKVTDAWFSAGYLNILASYPCGDPALHATSASYTVSLKGITLRLLHEGTPGEKENDVFLCIPMEEPLRSYVEFKGPAVTYPVPLLLQWSWYTLNGGPLMLYEREGTYSPES